MDGEQLFGSISAEHYCIRYEEGSHWLPWFIVLGTYVSTNCTRHLTKSSSRGHTSVFCSHHLNDSLSAAAGDPYLSKPNELKFNRQVLLGKPPDEIYKFHCHWCSFSPCLDRHTQHYFEMFGECTFLFFYREFKLVHQQFIPLHHIQ